MMDFSGNIKDVTMLLEKLNTEGRVLAAEYISYLVMTGKYSAEGKRPHISQKGV